MNECASANELAKMRKFQWITELLTSLRVIKFGLNELIPLRAIRLLKFELRVATCSKAVAMMIVGPLCPSNRLAISLSPETEFKEVGLHFCLCVTSILLQRFLVHSTAFR